MNETTLTLNVTGMTCGGCAARVQAALEGAAGVSEASVDLEAETATVVADADAVQPEVLIRAVADAGYTAETVATTPTGEPGS